MVLIVQKYGGTSLDTTEKIKAVARRVQTTVNRGNKVIVVVSAMGKTTDTLVDLAQNITKNPSSRELDMLLSTGEQVSIALMCMAIQELGLPAISLTGAQVGILTEAAHSCARILQVKTNRIKKHLDRSEVVVIAGFQGISNCTDLEITTLGRGGSDTSAVAIAASLGATFCEICTDVTGIFTTDPRLVSDARMLEEISYDEMLELASLGAKVLHPRAVEIARNYNVPIVVRSSHDDKPGTRVTSSVPISPINLMSLEISKVVNAIKFDNNQAKVVLSQIPKLPNFAPLFFEEIARQKIDIDLIIQSIDEENTNDIAFTVKKNQLKTTETFIETLCKIFGFKSNRKEKNKLIVERNIAKVTISGAGMIGHPGIVAKILKTLAEVGINIQLICTSEIQVSCVIDANLCEKAISVLCNAFNITSSPVKFKKDIDIKSRTLAKGVALDLDLVCFSIRQFNTRPDITAEIFATLAQYNINVDIIIQSHCFRVINEITNRNITFTVSKLDADRTKKILKILAVKIGCLEILSDTEIAKVSIVGDCMIGQPGVAAKVFRAITDENINIEMITTSEITITCIVAKENGIKALQAVHTAFNLADKKDLSACG